ncbi:MAG TPA: nucleotide exchange factor GrpE [Flavobacteriales bacterium]
MNNEPTKDTLDEQENTTQPEVSEATENTENAEATEAPAQENEAEKWQKEAAEWKDKYMRLYAEFDNFRKRSIKEKSDILATAAAGIVKDLLPVMDDFDRAVKANETTEDIQAVKEGFVLIQQKFNSALTAKGLKPINAIGQVFDTDYHEAITQIPAPSEDMKGKVVDELEKGYLLNDKVVRFSKVVIGQ